ncbi:hypothetical protein ANRL1_03959 [Anaerolineae bacterium]|nr:hypothetical protein ANRL1_03959 [Anaerolineae bacterium]
MPTELATLAKLAADDRALIQQVPLSRVWQASQRAHLRVHLFITGETHRILGEFAKQMSAEILDAANRDGMLDAMGVHRVQSEMERAWGKVIAEWKTLFYQAREETAAAPFAVMAAEHARVLVPAIEAVANKSESRRDRLESLREFTEASPTDVTYVFDPQLKAVMDAAANRVYPDKLKLSQRIWNLDQNSRYGISNVLYNGIANSKSAWDIAKDLEAYLGAGKDCPRWTWARLYNLTKKEIATGDTRGLLRGDECDGRGVAYNALRVARTEISAVHAMATEDAMARMPWIEKEQFNLSKAHPVKDICDDWAKGGEGGQGIYKKGTIKLPLHPHDLCFVTSVQMEPDKFTANVRAWMRGEDTRSGFARGMDQYAAMMRGAGNVVKVVQIALPGVVGNLSPAYQ